MYVILSFFAPLCLSVKCIIGDEGTLFRAEFVCSYLSSLISWLFQTHKAQKSTFIYDAAPSRPN